MVFPGYVIVTSHNDIHEKGQHIHPDSTVAFKASIFYIYFIVNVLLSLLAEISS